MASSSTSLPPAVLARLQRDFALLKRTPVSEYFSIHDLHHDRLNEWIVFLIAPTGTVYAGGIFKILVRFPDAFPMEPPSVTFLAPMWHPNVYRDGKVCLSVLQVPPPNCPVERLSEYWRPVSGVEQVLLSVIALLSSPEPADPANAAAASQFVNDKTGFEAKVKQIVRQSLDMVPSDFIKPVVISPPRAVDPLSLEPTPKRVSQAVAVEDTDEEYAYDMEFYPPTQQDSQQDYGTE